VDVTNVVIELYRRKPDGRVEACRRPRLDFNAGNTKGAKEDMKETQEQGMFADAVGYPIRFGGWAMIVTGAVLSVVLDFLQAVPVAGMAIGAFAFGFFCGFYLSIVSTTIAGDDGVPDWPDVTDFIDDIGWPLVRVVGLGIISFVPVIVVINLVPEHSSAFPWAVGAAVAAGCFYFPMALLGSTVCGNLYGALPHIVLPGIFRALPGYLLAVPALVIAFVAGFAAEVYSSRIPYVGWFVASAVAIYSMMIQARLIGLIYRRKREVLGWE
jgi:hypothetical protein